MLGLAAQTRHCLAFACSVELPSVVVALDVPADGAASGQGCVAMRAAIEQRDALSSRVAKCNDW